MQWKNTNILHNFNLILLLVQYQILLIHLVTLTLYRGLVKLHFFLLNLAGILEKQTPPTADGLTN
jgi:hypothetical protein